MTEKWSAIPTTSGYDVIDQNGRLIAKCFDQGNAHLIAQLPQLKELRYDWAVIINRLAHIARGGAESSNDNDYAEEMIEMVRPLLGCAYIEVGEAESDEC